MRSLREPKALTIQPMRCRSDQNMAEMLSKRPQENSFQVVHFTSARRFDDGQVVVRMFLFAAVVGDPLDHGFGVVSAGKGAFGEGPIVLGSALVIGRHGSPTLLTLDSERVCSSESSCTGKSRSV